MDLLQNVGPKDNGAIRRISYESVIFLIAPIITWILTTCCKVQPKAFVFIYTMQVMLLLFLTVVILF